MKIKCAAIKDKDGRVFEGRCHATIILAQEEDKDWQDSIQGFVTEDGQFYNREESAKIAVAAKQVHDSVDWLQSEHLTGDWPWKKKDE